MTSQKSSENDQSTGHFQSSFPFFTPPPSDPKSEKKSCKSTTKKTLALFILSKLPCGEQLGELWQVQKRSLVYRVFP